jgi:hypothetical protein
LNVHVKDHAAIFRSSVVALAYTDTAADFFRVLLYVPTCQRWLGDGVFMG